MCSWAVYVRNFNVFERSLRHARSSPTQSLSFYRPPGRAQTSLEDVEITNMHSPGTHKHQVSFVYLISLIFDALLIVIHIPTQTFIRS